MFEGELTIHDVLNDALIRQVMRADGISSGQLRSLLHEARERHLIASCRDMGRSGTIVTAASKKCSRGRTINRKSASQQNII